MKKLLIVLGLVLPMSEFIKKFNTDILINIEPCIDIIFMDYKAIKFNHFFTIIKYASAGLFDVNEHNISIYFKWHKVNNYLCHLKYIMFFLF